MRFIRLRILLNKSKDRETYRRWNREEIVSLLDGMNKRLLKIYDIIKKY